MRSIARMGILSAIGAGLGSTFGGVYGAIPGGAIGSNYEPLPNGNGSSPWTNINQPYSYGVPSPGQQGYNSGQPEGIQTGVSNQPNYNQWGIQMPRYNSGDARGLYTSDKIKADLSGVQEPDMRGLNAYREEGMRSGLGRGGLLAMQRSQLDEAKQRDMLAGTTAGNAATDRSRAAMQGGLSSASSAAIGRNALRSNLSGQQQIGSSAASDRLNIGMQDEANRLGVLGNLGNVENQYAKTGLDKAKIGATAYTNDSLAYRDLLKDQNKWNRDNYSDQMNLYAANQTANATANSGKK